MEVKHLLVAAIVCCAGPAMADPDAVEQAKLHFKNGTDLYDENNFRGALVEFQRAYELAPSYRILFNIGQVDMELQDYAGAMKAYSRYLREGGPDIPADRVTQVNSEIERLKGRIGHVIVQTNAGAEVTIDDVQAGFAPLPESVAVNTGRHRVVVTVSGHPSVSRVVDVAGQQDVTIAMPVDIPQVTNPPPVGAVEPNKEPAKPKPDGPPSNVPKYLAWGATGAFAVTSVVFAFAARSDEQDLQKLRTTFPVTKSDLDDAVSKETRAAALADGFGAAALVTGGIALYLTLRHTDTGEEAQKTVQLHVTPAGASITGHF
jgi:hypothetical protein